MSNGQNCKNYIFATCSDVPPYRRAPRKWYPWRGFGRVGWSPAGCGHARCRRLRARAPLLLFFYSSFFEERIFARATAGPVLAKIGQNKGGRAKLPGQEVRRAEGIKLFARVRRPGVTGWTPEPFREIGCCVK